MTNSADTPGSIDLSAPAWVDLRQYDQSHFDRGRPNWLILVWWLVQSIAFPITPHSFNTGRCWLLRCFGAEIGRDVIIRPTVRVTYPWRLSIGDNSWIGDRVVIYSLDRISIGSHSVVSQYTYLCTGSHDRSDPAFGLQTGPIAIGNGVWIAAQCFVAPGVQIGSNAAIGVRSTVLASMPAGYACWGHPCRPQQVRSMRKG